MRVAWQRTSIYVQDVTIQKLDLGEALHIDLGALAADVLPDRERPSADRCQQVCDLLVVKLKVRCSQQILFPPLQQRSALSALGVSQPKVLDWTDQQLNPYASS